MTTAKKSAAKKKPTRKTGSETNACWPGYEPVPGKAHNEKGSCKPIPGEHSKATKRATQKTAAASRLEKAGKPKAK